jgi:hypothetical protein
LKINVERWTVNGGRHGINTKTESDWVRNMNYLGIFAPSILNPKFRYLFKKTSSEKCENFIQNNKKTFLTIILNHQNKLKTIANNC